MDERPRRAPPLAGAGEDRAEHLRVKRVAADAQVLERPAGVTVRALSTKASVLQP
jgi:hypothetical protein